MNNNKEETVAIERMEISDDEDDNFNYEAISDNDYDIDNDDDDEDLESLLRTVNKVEAEKEV